MAIDCAPEIAALRRLTVGQLRQRYAEVFEESARTNNKIWLLKRIAWRLQALAEGDLSERARQRAAELAHDADLRLSPPRDLSLPAEQAQPAKLRLRGNDRLPPPGTILTRPYKGTTLRVRVLPHGFDYQGQVYPSLSAVAKAITGSHCNGFLFFRLATNQGVAS
jgi:hypothetical protein